MRFMNIPDLIKAVRKRHKLTQESLSRMLGKSRPTVTKYELGTVIPPGNILLKIQELEAASNE